ncbi:ABC transporter ATP-binding protein [Rhodococcus fascians]|nr:ABC transporter ATP-binding protein [Rhodococcus fascians]
MAGQQPPSLTAKEWWGVSKLHHSFTNSNQKELTVPSAEIVRGSSISLAFKSQIVLESADFDIVRGQRVGVVGSNGSGKTSLMRLISGLITPDSGTVLTFGQIASNLSRANRRRASLFLGGDASLYGSMSAEENIEYFAQLLGMPSKEVKSATSEIMKSLDVEWFSDKKIRDVSRGMRQRVALARAMVHKPELLLLDEPTTGMDIDGIQLFQELISSSEFNDTSIVLSGHSAHELVALCDKFWLVWDRKVTASTRHDLDSLPLAPGTAALQRAMSGVPRV